MFKKQEDFLTCCLTSSVPKWKTPLHKHIFCKSSVQLLTIIWVKSDLEKSLIGLSVMAKWHLYHIIPGTLGLAE